VNLVSEDSYIVFPLLISINKLGLSGASIKKVIEIDLINNGGRRFSKDCSKYLHENTDCSAELISIIEDSIDGKYDESIPYIISFIPKELQSTRLVDAMLRRAEPATTSYYLYL